MSLTVFSTRIDATACAADLIKNALQTELQTSDEATLVVSGGSTPGPCFDLLADTDLPWSRVAVTLTDERCVPPDHADSNARLVRERLLVNHAAVARFIPLNAENASNFPERFACTLLGMGADGHFASLFPDADNLAQGLALDNPAPCLTVHTQASEHARISMTLNRLLQSRTILLLVFGDDKRRILDAPGTLPVSHLLGQTRTPVQIIWAP